MSIQWKKWVLAHAASIVRSYSTGVTVRQLFYRLVADQTLPNTDNTYNSLCRTTAEARREGWFPEFIDNTRIIHRTRDFPGPQGALGWLADTYRRNRTEGQEWSVYLAVEKRGIVQQLLQWFGNDLGVPVLSLGGYSSQTYCNEVVANVSASGRPAVLLYSGDFDPSGEDIFRDFVKRTNCWGKVVQVALSPEQVDRYGLPENPAPESDARSKGFYERHGRLVQVELDALPPDTLRDLYQGALTDFWDTSAYRRAIIQEAEDQNVLRSYGTR